MPSVNTWLIVPDLKEFLGLILNRVWKEGILLLAGIFHYQNGSGYVILIHSESEFCLVKSHDDCETSPEWETISQYRIVFCSVLYIWGFQRHNSSNKETKRQLDPYLALLFKPSLGMKSIQYFKDPKAFSVTLTKNDANSLKRLSRDWSHEQLAWKALL